MVLFIKLLLLLLVSQVLHAETNNSENKNKQPVIAYHVDFRVQVMPITALKAMVKEISSLGFNTIIMEWEATYHI